MSDKDCYVISAKDEQEWERLQRRYRFWLWCLLPARLLLWAPYVVCKAFEFLGDQIDGLDGRITALAMRSTEDKQDALLKRIRRERHEWNDAKYREETDRMLPR